MLDQSLVLQEHERRIAELEQALAARTNPRLRHYNENRKARAARLDDAIRRVLAAAGPVKLTAKAVLKRLDLVALQWPDISVRTVSEHMAAIRSSTQATP